MTWFMQTTYHLIAGSINAKKQGDFGIFTACTDEKKNGSLRFKHLALMTLSYVMHMLYCNFNIKWTVPDINHVIWSFGRLDCYYQECPNPPHTSFSCEFKTSNKKILAIKENMMCKNYTVPLTVHNPKEDNVTYFTCTLTRNKRKEEKNITINYSIKKGQR